MVEEKLWYLELELRHGVEAHPQGGDENQGDGEQGQALKHVQGQVHKGKGQVQKGQGQAVKPIQKEVQWRQGKWDIHWTNAQQKVPKGHGQAVKQVQYGQRQKLNMSRDKFRKERDMHWNMSFVQGQVHKW
jgi:hypothetical protein